MNTSARTAALNFGAQREVFKWKMDMSEFIGR
jgi:hypothetical protein